MSDAVDRQLRELTKRAGGPLTIDASGFDSIGGYVHLLVTYWTWEPAERNCPDRRCVGRRRTISGLTAGDASIG